MIQSALTRPHRRPSGPGRSLRSTPWSPLGPSRLRRGASRLRPPLASATPARRLGPSWPWTSGGVFGRLRVRLSRPISRRLVQAGGERPDFPLVGIPESMRVEILRKPDTKNFPQLLKTCRITVIGQMTSDMPGSSNSFGPVDRHQDPARWASESGALMELPSEPLTTREPILTLESFRPFGSRTGRAASESNPPRHLQQAPRPACAGLVTRHQPRRLAPGGGRTMKEQALKRSPNRRAAGSAPEQGTVYLLSSTGSDYADS